jgi:hypothetical protein
MHVFARLNGFVVPGAPAHGDVPPLPQRPPPGPPAPASPAGNPAAEQVLAAAAKLEEAIHDPTPIETPRHGTLFVVREDGTPLEVSKDRFVIGRGRHCDLVIDSAVIVREGTGWVIEDLGSSNGTWHQRERIGRRRIADGDEYFVCSEKIRCVLR